MRIVPLCAFAIVFALGSPISTLAEFVVAVLNDITKRNANVRCAPRSLGKEDDYVRDDIDRNLSQQPNGKPIPSGRTWPVAGSESCVVSEQSELRSVDSEHRAVRSSLES